MSATEAGEPPLTIHEIQETCAPLGARLRKVNDAPSANENPALPPTYVPESFVVARADGAEVELSFKDTSRGDLYQAIIQPIKKAKQS